MESKGDFFMSLYNIFILFYLFLFLLLLFLFSRYLKIYLTEFYTVTNKLRDERVDSFFIKAIVISEQLAAEEHISPNKMDQWTQQKSIAIVTDVLLQNGFNPKNYALSSLVYYHRRRLGIRYATSNGNQNIILANKGVIQNGKS